MAPKPKSDETLERAAMVQLDRAWVESYGSGTFQEALYELSLQARLSVQAHQVAISYVPDGDFQAAIHTHSFSQKYEKYNTYDVMPTGEGIWGVVVESCLAVRMTNEELHSHLQWKNFSDLRNDRGLEHPPMRGWLAVPILRQDGAFVGVLQASDKYEGEFTEDDLSEFIHVAKMIAPTFELQYVNQKLQRRAEDLEQWTVELDRANEALEQSTEELQQRNKDLDDFAYVASHDLRSPLRAIDNLAKWISEDDASSLSEQSASDLKQLCERVGRMNALLNGLLQYSRVGRKKFDPDKIDCGAMALEIAEVLDRPEEFIIEVGDELPTFTAHRVPLEQVLRNLIDNAIKHHDRSDGRVVIAARKYSGFVEFSVSDDGPGIAEQYHQQVFQIFETMKTRDQVEGSGLGLALVKKTVETYGGKITLESAEGKGATFRFTWPRNE